MTQIQAINSLIAKLKSDVAVLTYGQNIASAVVNGPKNHCAATLSALLGFVGIFPNGSFTGPGDLEPWVPSLAFDLQNRRGWSKIDLGMTIAGGDVGVVLAQAIHHIYLVVDATNQAEPMIADNQAAQLHTRKVAGDPAQGWSPTSYFLRVPSS